jgi:hypothetical protein
MCDAHAGNWQESGVLTDRFRLEVCNTVFFTLHHAQASGISCMDFKQDNIRIRGTGPHKGRAAITDLGNGHMFPVDPTVGRAMMPYLLQRKTTEAAAEDKAAAQGAAQGRCRQKQLPPGLLRVPRPKNGASYVSITREQTKEFQRRATEVGLANLNGCTLGFRDRVNVAQQTRLRSYAAAAGKLKTFDRKCAVAADLFAACRIILMVLTRKANESIQVWNDRAVAAEDAGEAGIQAMLLGAVKPGITVHNVKQPMALERLVDLLTRGLQRDNRLDLFAAMSHEANTLPILTPEYEDALKQGGGIPLPQGGRVKDFFKCPFQLEQALPKLEFCLQPGMGMGVRALQRIQEGTVLGFYVGTSVPNHVCGRVYITPFYVSRFLATITGNSSLLKEKHVPKLSCDAQNTLDRDFEWARNNNVVGPYLNAASDPNCIVDRIRAWEDSITGLLCMLVISSKDIRRIRELPNESVTESSEASSRASVARASFFETIRLYTTGRYKHLSVVAIR